MLTNLTLPILYSFRRCPYAMRARMAIYIAGVSVQTIEVSLKNKPASLLNYSPKGTVPVLVTASGEVIEQSREIMLWALQQSDPDNWLMQSNTSAQQKTHALIDNCDINFKPWLNRYKYFDRFPEKPQEYYRQQAEIFLSVLEHNLSHHEFLIAHNISFADVAIFPFIRQFSSVDKEWFSASDYKNLQHWLDTCTSTVMFKKIMDKI